MNPPQAYALPRAGRSRAALTFEEKCRDAFTQIENLTGAQDLSEVLHTVTSKVELSEQLQRRVAAVQERIGALGAERGNAAEQLTDAMYGTADDEKIKHRVTECRTALGTAQEKLDGAHGRMSGAMRLLQDTRLAWEHVVRMLEAGAVNHRLGGAPAMGANRSELAVTQSTLPTPASERRGSAASRGESEGGEGAVDLTMLPVDLAELPVLVDEAEARALRVLMLTERAELRGAGARHRAEDESVRSGNSAALAAVRASSPPPSSSPAPAAVGASPAAARRKGKPAAAAPAATAGTSVNANIRIVPPEMRDELLTRDELLEDKPGSRGKGAPGRPPPQQQTGGELAFGKEGDVEEELMSREDLKAVSTRLARKAARRSGAAAGRAK